jgi:hypothetical protein
VQSCHRRTSQLTAVLDRTGDDAALRGRSLAFVPTGQKPGEYRRVGLAIRIQCAWYGYSCGWKDERYGWESRPDDYAGKEHFLAETW